MATTADYFGLYKSGDSAFVVNREVFLELRADGVKVDRRFNNLVDWCKLYGAPHAIASRGHELWVLAFDGVEQHLYSLEGKKKWKTRWTPAKFWAADSVVPFPPDRWLLASDTPGCRETMIDDSFRMRRCEGGPRKAKTKLIIFGPNEPSSGTSLELPAACAEGLLAAEPVCPDQASGAIYAALDCKPGNHLGIWHYPKDEPTLLRIPRSWAFSPMFDVVSATDVVVAALWDEHHTQQMVRYDGQDLSVVPMPFSLVVHDITSDPSGGRWMVGNNPPQSEVWYMSPDGQFERVVLPTGFNPMRIWARDQGDIWITGVEGTTNVLYRSGGNETTVMEVQSKCPPYPWATP
ncbi:MAG: hypothetical protein U0271_20250 [Polyangiaceae bacterium]